MIVKTIVIFAGGCLGVLLANIIYAASHHNDDRG